MEKRFVPLFILVLLSLFLSACKEGAAAPETTESGNSSAVVRIDITEASWNFPETVTPREEAGTLALYRGETQIGGLSGYEISEETYSQLNFANAIPWLMELTWEGEDPNLGHYGEGGYGDYIIEFFTDVPPGTDAEKVHRWHHFIFSEDLHTFYDLWLDLTLVDAVLWEAVDTAVTEKIQEPLPTETQPSSYVSFTDHYTSKDGTVTYLINTEPVDQTLLQAAHGISLEQLMENVKDEFLTTSVDSFGFDPKTLGPEGDGASLEIEITSLKKGSDYLLASDWSVPTVEVWGKRTYRLSNGETVGEEEEVFSIMMMNALNGDVLARIGKK